MTSPSISVRNCGNALSARLGGREVVLVAPVAAEVLDVRERDALRPVVDGLRVGPARTGEAGAEVVDRGRGDLDAERDDVSHGRSGHPAKLPG